MRMIVLLGDLVQGVTSLHLAVYKYEETRNLEMVKFLLAHGANISLKAAVLPSAHKISIIRHAQFGTPMETKKVTLDQKTPLLVALELKSTLYQRGESNAHNRFSNNYHSLHL